MAFGSPVDELRGDPPRERSEAYLEALRREQARRQRVRDETRS